MGLPPWSMTLKGHDLMSLVTVSSSNRRPIKRLRILANDLSIHQGRFKTYLTSKTVFSGFIAAWFLAASPIKRSSLVNETKEGVVKEPCSLATTQLSLEGVHSGRRRGGRILISTLVPS
jgi:hypothetical protein